MKRWRKSSFLPCMSPGSSTSQLGRVRWSVARGFIELASSVEELEGETSTNKEEDHEDHEEEILAQGWTVV